MSERVRASDISGISIDVLLIQGRHLVPRDRHFGTFGKKTSSDPYVEINCGGKYYGRTKTANKTLSPVWNEKINFVVEENAQPRTLEIILMDEDKHSADDGMGSALIPLPSNVEEEIKAKWYPVEPGKIGEKHYCKKASGEVEVAVKVSFRKSNATSDESKRTDEEEKKAKKQLMKMMTQKKKDSSRSEEEEMKSSSRSEEEGIKLESAGAISENSGFIGNNEAEHDEKANEEEKSGTSPKTSSTKSPESKSDSGKAADARNSLNENIDSNKESDEANNVEESDILSSDSVTNEAGNKDAKEDDIGGESKKDSTSIFNEENNQVNQIEEAKGTELSSTGDERVQAEDTLVSSTVISTVEVVGDVGKNNPSVLEEGNEEVTTSVLEEGNEEVAKQDDNMVHTEEGAKGEQGKNSIEKAVDGNIVATVEAVEKKNKNDITSDSDGENKEPVAVEKMKAEDEGTAEDQEQFVGKAASLVLNVENDEAKATDSFEEEERKGKEVDKESQKITQVLKGKIAKSLVGAEILEKKAKDDESKRIKDVVEAKIAKSLVGAEILEKKAKDDDKKRIKDVVEVRIAKSLVSSQILEKKESKILAQSNIDNAESEKEPSTKAGDDEEIKDVANHQIFDNQYALLHGNDTQTKPSRCGPLARKSVCETCVLQ